MPTKLCPICGEQVPAVFFDRHRWREQRALKALREEHPEWAGNGELAEECLRVYRQNHEELRAEARRLRQERGEFYEVEGEVEDVGEDNADAELHVATDDFDLQHQADD